MPVPPLPQWLKDLITQLNVAAEEASYPIQDAIIAAFQNDSKRLQGAGEVFDEWSGGENPYTDFDGPSEDALDAAKKLLEREGGPTSMLGMGVGSMGSVINPFSLLALLGEEPPQPLPPVGTGFGSQAGLGSGLPGQVSKIIEDRQFSTPEEKIKLKAQERQTVEEQIQQKVAEFINQSQRGIMPSPGVIADIVRFDPETAAQLIQNFYGGGSGSEGGGKSSGAFEPTVGFGSTGRGGLQPSLNLKRPSSGGSSYKAPVYGPEPPPVNNNTYSGQFQEMLRRSKSQNQSSTRPKRKFGSNIKSRMTSRSPSLSTSIISRRRPTIR